MGNSDARWAGTMAFPNPCPAHRGQYFLSVEARHFFSLATSRTARAATLPMTQSFPCVLWAVPPAAANHLPLPLLLQALVQQRRSRESLRRTLHLGRLGTARRWAHRPARSCRRTPSPKHLSGVACLAPKEQHYPIASRFIRRLGADRA